LFKGTPDVVEAGQHGKMGGEALRMFGPGFKGKAGQQEHAFNVTQELGWRR
jgi:hypothetical protein